MTAAERAQWGPNGPPAGFSMYVIVEPRAPGNPTDRWMTVLEPQYKRALVSGSHSTYMASRHDTRQEAQDFIDARNLPLYPPTDPDMPREQYWALMAASKERIAAARKATKRRAREREQGRAPFGKPMFDPPVDLVPHTYPAILRTDEE